MRNIGIAIIDDESLVRLGIKSSVAWEEYGYEIVGEADNGQTGLEMIREKHPDIVLLDVCMPVMNGIEVLKSLQKLKIQCKVIILSCHDDFCFVKEAMKNGAFDYLRKNEINSANILTVLEEVRHSLCKKQDEGQGGWDSYARHVCLHRLITGSSEPAERQLPVSQLHIREGNLCCIVFAVQNYQKVQARYGEGRPFPLEQSVINLTVEVLHQWTQELEVFLLQENRYVILLSSQNSVSSTQWEEKACSLVHELHTVFQNYLNADTLLRCQQRRLEILCTAGGVRARALLSAASLFSAGQVPYQGDAQAGSDDEPPGSQGMPWQYQYLCVAEAIHANLFPILCFHPVAAAAPQGEPGRYGGAELFLQYGALPSPAGGKGAGRNGGKASGLRNRGGSAAFP